MQIRTERISIDIHAIAGLTETPGGGISRPTFTPAWAAARDYVIEQAARGGCRHRIDAAGNVHIRQNSVAWDQHVWLSGSHIDTVPNGGAFDGVTGVVVALEILRAAHEAAVALPLELIIFAEEEGTTFNLGMLGSRAWCGTLSAEQLGAVRNRDGLNYLQAGERYGVDAQRLAVDRINPSHYCGLIEVHVEQGPALWEQKIPIAVVTAINGRRQYAATIRGQANHAGSTPMQYRQDALAGAALFVSSMEQCAKAMAEQTPGTVITVGQLWVEPNAINVIPGSVRLTIDARSSTDAMLTQLDGVIRATLAGICKERGLEHDLTTTESLPAMPLDAGVLSTLREAARRSGVESITTTTSGALHDAAIVAPFVPTAMLFVASRDGISHNPAEFSRMEDIALAARVLAEAVRQLPARRTVKLSSLNAADRNEFVKSVGAVWEHSPWIAFGAWAARPFRSIDELLGAMSAVVMSSPPEAQLALIGAHPDLVGKLAQQGKLTVESAREQQAAGLAQLSAEEVAAFERYNAAYRAKFRFPFVICARENRKDAILAAFPQRLENTSEAEVQTALREIGKIARLRLADLIEEDA